jgi:hypothetical protein
MKLLEVAGLEVSKKKIFCFCRQSNHDSSIVKHLA